VPLLKPPHPQLSKIATLRARPLTRAHLCSPIARPRRLGHIRQGKPYFAAKFHRAEAFFTRLFAPTRRRNTQHLCRYFTVPQLWEIGQTSQLTRADRESLRGGDQWYQGQLFDHACRESVDKGLSPHQVSALVNPGSGATKKASSGEFVGNWWLQR